MNYEKETLNREKLSGFNNYFVEHLIALLGFGVVCLICYFFGDAMTYYPNLTSWMGLFSFFFLGGTVYSDENKLTILSVIVLALLYLFVPVVLLRMSENKEYRRFGKKALATVTDITKRRREFNYRVHVKFQDSVGKVINSVLEMGEISVYNGGQFEIEYLTKDPTIIRKAKSQ